MSIRIMTKVFDLSVGNSGEKLVLLALADNANDAGACWPSLKTLARKCSMSAAGVVGILGRLEKRKLITREKGGGVKNTRYQFGNELACPDQSTTFTGGSQRRLQGESTTFTAI